MLQCYITHAIVCYANLSVYSPKSRYKCSLELPLGGYFNQENANPETVAIVAADFSQTNLKSVVPVML